MSQGVHMSKGLCIRGRCEGISMCVYMSPRCVEKCIFPQEIPSCGFRSRPWF